VELARRGHEVAVLTLDQAKAGAAPTVDDSPGYPVFAAARTDLALGPVADDVGAEVVVVAAYHRERSDWTRAVVEAAAPRRTLLYVHDVGGAELAARLGQEVDAVAAVSEFVAGAIRDHGGDAVAVPPLVPLTRYRVATSRTVALLVNPIPQKGLRLALALAGRRPDVEFAFTRCWPIDPRALRALRAAARRLGNVEIRSTTPYPAELYGDARVLLVPSRYPEAWGRVTSEAQASGIPVLASAVGALPAAVGDGGVLIDPEAGLDAWLDGFTRVWDDSPEYALLAARAESNARRTDDRTGELVEHFEALLGQRAPV
jgi:glycosyltransferase involved in cell wall biosynthesis